MNYNDIIQKNIRENSSVEWWPRYAYHFTNISNALKILETGKLYSRSSAVMLGVMNNDNASMQVIDMTNIEAKRNVRFYFRPLTPTQYYNEGYKHPDLRYSEDRNANCPVPVFFAFDLAKFLSLPGCTFSETSRAGNAPALLSGVEEYSKLNFQMIYKNGPMENPEIEKLYRQAELSQVSPMEINSCLSYILCRNEFEQSMLLMMLKDISDILFCTYKPIIKVCKTNMFQNNGFFIENCYYLNKKNRLSIVFSDSYEKQRFTSRQMQNNHIESLKPLNAEIQLDWYKSKSPHPVILHRAFSRFTLDYDETSIGFQLPEVKHAYSMRMKLSIENDMLGYKEFLLEEEKNVF